MTPQGCARRQATCQKKRSLLLRSNSRMRNAGRRDFQSERDAEILNGDPVRTIDEAISVTRQRRRQGVVAVALPLYLVNALHAEFFLASIAVRKGRQEAAPQLAKSARTENRVSRAWRRAARGTIGSRPFDRHLPRGRSDRDSGRRRKLGRHFQHHGNRDGLDGAGDDGCAEQFRLGAGRDDFGRLPGRIQQFAEYSLHHRLRDDDGDHLCDRDQSRHGSRVRRSDRSSCRPF
jgi:hypothetical protein